MRTHPDPRHWILCTLVLLSTSWLSTAGHAADDPRREHAYRTTPSLRPVPATMTEVDDRLRPARPAAPVPTDPRDGRPVDDRSGSTLVGHPLGQLDKAPPPGSIVEVGGDDVVVSGANNLENTFLDIASNGDLYLGVRKYTGSPSYTEWIEVFRSTDGGDSFTLFGTITSPAGSYDRLVDLDVCEGTVDRVFLSYMHFDPTRGGFVGRVAYEDLSATTATWTIRDVYDTPGVSFLNPDLDADDENFSSYYLYTVVSGIDGNGDDIWYSRSTDQGNTWSAPYRVASLTTSGNLMYSRPVISYGFGGVLHLAYTYTERLQSTINDAVRYRQATNYGANSGDWAASYWSLTQTTDPIGNNVTSIAASTSADNVVLVYREGFVTPKVIFDAGAGTTWSLVNIVDPPVTAWGKCLYDPTGGRFHLAGRADGSRLAVLEAAETDMGNWSLPHVFSELTPSGNALPGLALDPTRGNRRAVSWRSTSGAGYQITFDAEWRSDPGYPNTQTGFPYDLPVSPSTRGTSPALADLDGDGTQDVIFSNTDGQVFAISPVFGMLDGWPQDVGDIPFGSAVAVGDLNGNGELSVVTGTTDGRVFCFDPSGNLRDGFPVDMGTAAPTFVSIGAAGAPYVRWILAVGGSQLARINYRGLTEFKSGTLNGTYLSAPAIGDIDNDGDAEIVVNFQLTGGSGSGIHVYNADLQGGVQQFRAFGELPSEAVSLGDITGDGRLEICHPTQAGLVYVVDSSLADLPGFPFDSGTGASMTQAALGQILGASAPEIVVNSRFWSVHVVYSSGTQQFSYPANTGTGWFLFGSPVLGQFYDGFNHVFAASRDQMAWAFQNVSATLPPGWPKPLGDVVETTPAIGDIDNDGNLEMVYVTDSQLVVLDANTAAGLNPWPMYGHDAARTSCLNCTEDVVTAVGDPLATRLSFRVTSRNPAAGPVHFAADLPVAAAVDLQIYDVRGRAVRSLERSELGAGTQAFVFDGRDDGGHTLARGQYFARLTVRGAGLQEVVSQRFLLIDR